LAFFANGSTANGAFSPYFLMLGRTRLWGLVPLPVLVLAVVAILLWVLMERLRWGRAIYAVGGNELAAHLAGAPTARLRVAAYVISGLPRSAVFSLPRVSDVETSSPAAHCCRMVLLQR
jgi:ribose/xylose/arabinose/galactoside ABC-type transport system permease subunit